MTEQDMTSQESTAEDMTGKYSKFNGADRRLLQEIERPSLISSLLSSIVT
jgi:hypothetical protein